ncbi:MAG: response regulator [Desulfobacteraceae bacterium]|nr:MAG: response regulator [Desulfobacteraceae bacterium]
MRKAIIVLDPDVAHSRGLCAVLEREQYRAVTASSLDELQSCIDRNFTIALLLNLDLVRPDNSTLKQLRTIHRRLCIIGLSSRSFHPELKETLTRYIDACFSKPLDLEALLYYLKGAREEFSEDPFKILESEEVLS